MAWIGKLINGVKKVSSTVGKVAGALSGIPIVGGVASSVANIANTVNKGANIAEGIYNAVAPAAKEIGSQVKGAIDAGKQAWDAGNNNSPPRESPLMRAMKIGKLDPAVQQRVQNSPYKMMYRR